MDATQARTRLSASALITTELFRGRAKSQTVFGYDLNFARAAIRTIATTRPTLTSTLFVSFGIRGPAGLGATAAARVRPISSALGAGHDLLVDQDGPLKKPYFDGCAAHHGRGKNYVLLQQTA